MAEIKKWKVAKPDETWKREIIERDLVDLDRLQARLAYVLFEGGGLLPNFGVGRIRELTGGQIADALVSYRTSLTKSLEKSNG